MLVYDLRYGCALFAQHVQCRWEWLEHSRPLLPARVRLLPKHESKHKVNAVNQTPQRRIDTLDWVISVLFFLTFYFFTFFVCLLIFVEREGKEVLAMERGRSKCTREEEWWNKKGLKP